MIKLTSGFALDSALTINKDVTIDLNGKNITTDSGKAIVIAGGDVTLKGTGSVSSNSIAVEVTSGSATIESGSYSGLVPVVVRAGAQGTIKGGSFSSASNAAVQVQGAVTIEGGSFSSDTACALNALSGETTIKGGTFSSAADVTIEAHSKLTIDGGTVNCNSSNLTDYAVLAYAGSNVVINDGTFTATSTNDCIGAQDGGVVTIKDGSFSADKITVVSMSGSTITIEGGTFESAIDDVLNEYVVGTAGEIVVKGGSFVDEDPTEFVDSGYAATNNNGTWTVAATPAP